MLRFTLRRADPSGAQRLTMAQHPYYSGACVAEFYVNKSAYSRADRGRYSAYLKLQGRWMHGDNLRDLRRAVEAEIIQILKNSEYV